MMGQWADPVAARMAAFAAADHVDRDAFERRLSRLRADETPGSRSREVLGNPGLAPGEYIGEAPLGERAEESVPGQPRARRCRARDADEEARLLPRRAERLGMAVAERVEHVDVEARLDRGLRLALGKLLGASVEAVAAVPARLGARLAEVADEGAHLTAVVGDEREDAVNPAGLGAFPTGEAP